MKDKELNKLSEAIRVFLDCKNAIVSEGTEEFSNYISVLSDRGFETFKKPKKKAVTPQWLISRLEAKDGQARAKREATEKAIQAIQRKRKDLSLDGVSCYGTTFGFSVCNLFSDGLSKANEICRAAGIRPKRIEYSEARWVCRVFI